MPNSGPTKTILIVEDDESIREAMRLYLEVDGYAVKTAGDGKEALELLAREPAPQMILLDLMMPVMDGYEFLRVRKMDAALSRIPVVIVSAFSGELPGVNVQGMVGKPVDFDRLRELMRRYVG
jgi:CheY-like chemotaxis protein